MFWKGGQYVKQANSVSILFSQSQDSSTANTDSSITNISNGLQAIFVGTSRNDLGVVLWTSVEVVIVGGQTSLLELLCLLSVEHTQSAANLQTHSIDALHHFQDVVEGILLVAQLPPRSPHTEPSASSILRITSCLQDFLHFHGRRRLDVRLVTSRLRAIGAILRAATCLDAQESALLNLCWVPVHAMSRRGTVHELVEGKVVNLGNILLRPVMTDRGSDPAHSTALFLFVKSIPIVNIVGETRGCVCVNHHFLGSHRKGSDSNTATKKTRRGP
mmetsp:Transcript_6976/g.11573  ORF Transcript_6976/g.11573 Transcript_6976/m.11573 type:complete len:274 (+) Transcript_6976:132-953(+)